MIRRTKKPVVEFTTCHKHVAEMFPPVPASRHMPSWWKGTPAYVPEKYRRFPHLRLREDCTIKSCPGIHDYLAHGWMLPLWADIILGASENGFNYDLALKSDEVGSFSPLMLGNGFPRRAGDHTFVLKLISPWQVHASKGWSLMVLPPLYQEDQPWTVLPGIIDSDRLPVLNVIAEWHSPLGKAELMKAGTPLLHIVPFRRAEVDLKVTAVPRQEWIEAFGPGLDAVEGMRLAAGAYRENGRKQHART